MGQRSATGASYSSPLFANATSAFARARQRVTPAHQQSMSFLDGLPRRDHAATQRSSHTRWAKRVVYERQKAFGLSDDQRRINDAITLTRARLLPTLVWSQSRKFWNKLMHSINGNTAAPFQFSQLPEELEYTPHSPSVTRGSEKRRRLLAKAPSQGESPARVRPTVASSMPSDAPVDLAHPSEQPIAQTGAASSASGMAPAPCVEPTFVEPATRAEPSISTHAAASAQPTFDDLFDG